MERILIEPVTKTNLVEVGDENLDALIGFHKIRVDKFAGSKDAEISSEILPVLENERDWRLKVKSIKCPWLQLSGYCRHAEVTARHGVEHTCPKLVKNPCTRKKMELFARF